MPKKSTKTADNGEVSTRTLRPKAAPQVIPPEPKKTTKKAEKKPVAAPKGKKRGTTTESKDEPKKKAPLVDDTEQDREDKEEVAPEDSSTLSAEPKKAEKKPAAAPKGKKKGTTTESKDEPNKKAPLVDDTKQDPEDKQEVAPEDSSTFHDFKAEDIEGKEVPLSQYKGHVCLVVNVASKCGHTASNYKELVELHNKYADEKGLRILAFPCNQFGKQEPGDNEKICEFAKKRNVEFDMFAKIDVNGKNAHPLWKWLTSQKDGPKGSQIDWNFTKFIIDKDGQVVERFKSAVKPLALVGELEKLW